MQNSSTTCKNNFPTGKMLSIILVGILVIGALTSLPFGDSKIAEGKMKIENHDMKKNRGLSFEGNLDISKNDGISINGCDQSGRKRRHSHIRMCQRRGWS